MTITSSRTSQAGSVSATLTAVGGFAAGAVVAGLVAFGAHPGSGTGASDFSPVQFGAAPSAAAASPVEWPASSTLRPAADSAAGLWNFESATARSPGAPGRNRPDRLSAPEGWTYDATAP